MRTIFGSVARKVALPTVLSLVPLALPSCQRWYTADEKHHDAGVDAASSDELDGSFDGAFDDAGVERLLPLVGEGPQAIGALDHGVALITSGWTSPGGLTYMKLFLGDDEARVVGERELPPVRGKIAALSVASAGDAVFVGWVAIEQTETSKAIGLHEVIELRAVGVCRIMQSAHEAPSCVVLGEHVARDATLVPADIRIVANGQGAATRALIVATDGEPKRDITPKLGHWGDHGDNGDDDTISVWRPGMAVAPATKEVKLRPYSAWVVGNELRPLATERRSIHAFTPTPEHPTPLVSPALFADYGLFGATEFTPMIAASASASAVAGSVAPVPHVPLPTPMAPPGELDVAPIVVVGTSRADLSMLPLTGAPLGSAHAMSIASFTPPSLPLGLDAAVTFVSTGDLIITLYRPPLPPRGADQLPDEPRLTMRAVKADGTVVTNESPSGFVEVTDHPTICRDNHPVVPLTWSKGVIDIDPTHPGAEPVFPTMSGARFLPRIWTGKMAVWLDDGRLERRVCGTVGLIPIPIFVPGRAAHR